MFPFFMYASGATCVQGNSIFIPVKILAFHMMWIGGEDLGEFDEWTSKWKPVEDDTVRMAVPGG